MRFLVGTVLVATACASPDSTPASDTAAGGAAAPPTSGGAAGQPGGNAGRDCGASESLVLTEDGVGAFRVNASVADVRSRCNVVSDTNLAMGAEGQPERRLTVRVGDVPTTATVRDDRVWRIEIDSPQFRTSDSLGVGTTVGRLRQGGTARLALGEGAFVLRNDHCGLSFRLASMGRLPSTLASVPDSVRVERVLVTGCN